MVTFLLAVSHCEVLGHHRPQAQRSRIHVGLLQRGHPSHGWRWVVNAYKGDGKRYIVESDELLSAFVQL